MRPLDLTPAVVSESAEEPRGAPYVTEYKAASHLGECITRDGNHQWRHAGEEISLHQWRSHVIIAVLLLRLLSFAEDSRPQRLTATQVAQDSNRNSSSSQPHHHDQRRRLPHTLKAPTLHAKAAHSPPPPPTDSSPATKDVEKPSVVEVVNTGGFRILANQKEFGGGLFNLWLMEALVTGTCVPSPEIEIVEGVIEGVRKALDLHKKGLSGKKLVVLLK